MSYYFFIYVQIIIVLINLVGKLFSIDLHFAKISKKNETR